MKTTTWFVWNWKTNSNYRDRNFDNIVVSKSWLDVTVTINNLKCEGEIVAGPFDVLTDAISKCDELNQDSVISE